MMSENQSHEGQGQPPVTITIDGVEHTLEDRRKTAAELLTLAGISAADHDLAQAVGQGRVEKRFADEDIVQLMPGAKFVSIFTGSTPVV
jgi:hypothetical protein